MYEISLALRYIRQRVVCSLSVLCVALGVMIINVALAVMDGFQEKVKGGIRRNTPHIRVSANVARERYPWLEKEILAVPGAVACAPRIRGLAIIAIPERGVVTTGTQEGIEVIGIDPEREARVTEFRALLSAPGPRHRVEDPGDPFHVSDRILGDQIDPDAGAVVGVRLLQKFGLRVGSRITVVTVQLGGVTDGGDREGHRKDMIVAVTGAFESGMFTDDLRRIYVPLEAARRLRGMTTFTSEIGVRVEDPDRALAVKDALIGRLSERLRPVEFDPRDTLTWEEQNQNLFNALLFEKRLLAVLLFFIVLAACGMVLSILYMMVLEKRRDIGVLRSLGATVGGVLRIFLFTGGIIGFLGSLAGTGLGILFVWNINPIEGFVSSVTGIKAFPAEVYFLDEIPAILVPGTMAILALLTFGFSLLVSLFPALKAALSDPVEAIRYE